MVIEGEDAVAAEFADEVAKLEDDVLTRPGTQLQLLVCGRTADIVGGQQDDGEARAAGLLLELLVIVRPLPARSSKITGWVLVTLARNSATSLLREWPWTTKILASWIVGTNGEWWRDDDILRFGQADSRLDCDRRLAANFSPTPAALKSRLGAARHGQVEAAGLVVVRCDSEIAEFLEIVDGLLGRGRPRAIPAGVVYFRAFAAVVEAEDARLVAVGRPSFVGLADAAKWVYMAIFHRRRF